jgi:hypothetical protein
VCEPLCGSIPITYIVLRTSQSDLPTVGAAAVGKPDAGSRRRSSFEPHHDQSLAGGQIIQKPANNSGRVIKRPPLGRVRPEPHVHRLAGHPIAAGHIDHRRPLVEDLQHRLIALLHQPKLHQPRRPPPDLRVSTPTAKKAATASRWTLQVSARNRGHCHPGTGAASPKCQPATGATMSTMNRDCTSLSAVAWDHSGTSGAGEQKSRPRGTGSDLVTLLSGWRDSNPRPLDPQSSALPNCATARVGKGHRSAAAGSC